MILLQHFQLNLTFLHRLWGEDLIASMNFNIARYVLGLHVNWSINSVAHIWGMRPYDK